MNLPRGTQFILFFLLALVLTQVPYLNIVLEWYNTFFHELSHGIGAYITGGQALSMELNWNGAGRLVSSSSGLPTLVTFAGYFGAIAWGAAIYLVASRSTTVSNNWASVLAGIVFLSAVIWMRDLVSWAIAAVLTASFIAIWRLAESVVARFFLQLIGLYMIATGIASAWLLFSLSAHNDASSLAKQTWIPAFIWISIWIASGLGALWGIWRVESRQEH